MGKKEGWSEGDGCGQWLRSKVEEEGQEEWARRKGEMRVMAAVSDGWGVKLRRKGREKGQAERVGLQEQKEGYGVR